jgi:hypothetical protein
MHCDRDLHFGAGTESSAGICRWRPGFALASQLVADEVSCACLGEARRISAIFTSR